MAQAPDAPVGTFVAEDAADMNRARSRSFDDSQPCRPFSAGGDPNGTRPGMRWIQLGIVFLPTIPAPAKAFTRRQPAPK